MFGGNTTLSFVPPPPTENPHVSLAHVRLDFRRGSAHELYRFRLLVRKAGPKQRVDALVPPAAGLESKNAIDTGKRRRTPSLPTAQTAECLFLFSGFEKEAERWDVRKVSNGRVGLIGPREWQEA